MANTLFQSVIHQIKDSVNRTIGIVDKSGAVLACSDLNLVGTVRPAGSLDEVFASTEFVTADNYTFKTFGMPVHPEYAIFVEGTDDLAASYAGILSTTISSIKQYYDEKYDKAHFIKNVMLDNVLPGDIAIKAKELHFSNDVSRVVLLVRILGVDNSQAFDTIQALFPDRSKDFVINVSDTDIAIVKEVHQNQDTRDLEKLATSIADNFGSEYFTHTFVGIGTVVTGIKEIAQSFKESQVALEVGKVFDTEKTIISYDNLGIARLIYQLPTTLCEAFLKEVFKRGSIESLDNETLFTIQKFFENNLNVSETSRKLFVHRNTLVYRLEKIRKLTGLDLREFDDAIVFKVALMVKKYLDARPVRL